MDTIKVDITDVNTNDWVYQTNRKGRLYRQNVLVLKLRAAGIPAEGVKAFQGVQHGTFKFETTTDEKMYIVWSK